MSIFNELNRRNVLRVGAAYIVTSWLLIQVAETIFPLFGYGDGPARLAVIVLAIGFVPVLIFSWVFEWTPQGFKRDGEVDPEISHTPQTGKKLDRIIMLVLALALGYFAFDKFVLDPQRDVDMTEAAAEAAIEQIREETLLNMMSDKSIAVLPFDNRSNLDEDLFFTDGMHDELLTRLSRISALKVISRTSVMRYRDTLLSIPAIAKELSVATILEGGVQRAGNQIRINVQLIDARTDEHLWAEIYDREMSTKNLFAIQSEISESIAEALHATLSPEEKNRIADLPTDNLDAYNHFLRGRQLMATRITGKLQQALEEFTRATEIDPEFALAWVGIADSVLMLNFRGAFDRDRQLEVRQDAIDRALAINDQLGEAYTSLGALYEDKGGEFEKEQAAYIRAIELNPNYAQAYHWYANSLAGTADEETRLQLMYKAAELDPMSSIIQANLAAYLMWGGADADAERNREGRQVMLKLLERDPDFASGYQMLGNYHADWGQLAMAVQYYRKAMALDPDSSRGLLELASLYLSLGDDEAFETAYTQLENLAGPYSVEFLTVKERLFTARSQWQDKLDWLHSLPEEAPDGAKHPWLITFAYRSARDFDKALDSLLTWKPDILEPDFWEEFEGTNCNYGAMLIEAGHEDTGRQLLQKTLDNLNSHIADDGLDSVESIRVIECYLLNGEYDRTMDYVDDNIGRNSTVQNWYRTSKSPWWKPLEDNPRYQALVTRIEGLIAEQRTLLAKMEETETNTP